MKLKYFCNRTKKSLLGKETVTVPKEKWEQKHISANEKGYLQRATAEFEKTVVEFRETSSAKHIEQLEQKVSVLERQVYNLKRENNTLQNKILSADKEIDKIINRVNKVIDKLPDNTAEQFINQWKAEKNLEQKMSRGGMEK